MPDLASLASARQLVESWRAWASTRSREATRFRWRSLAVLIDAAEANTKSKHARIESLWEQYEERMPTWLQPDPSRENWNAFRPLRLTREEDRADWLGHLLQTCPNGAFHRDLFSEQLGDQVQAHREVLVNWDGRTGTDTNEANFHAAGCYRADLILTSESTAIHVEVKVGDPHLSKTWPTALAIRHGVHEVELPCGIGADYLLVMPWQMARQFDPIRQDLDASFGIEVKCLTWREVGLSLRRILQDMHHRQSWGLLARVFLGAVEQTLLHHSYRDPADGNRFVAADTPGTIQYLEEVLRD